jgi:hypothetical protein
VLVGDHLLLRDCGPYRLIFMNVRCYNRCHGDDKGFWALQNNIYDNVCLLLQIFPSFLMGNLLTIFIKNYKRINSEMHAHTVQNILTQVKTLTKQDGTGIELTQEKNPMTALIHCGKFRESH